MPRSKAINCIVVDDEKSSQRVMEHFIQETEILELLAVCNNASEAFKFLQLHPEVDLIFLDINMPQQSGLDFYKSLVRPPKVIFTTAYPQYAVDGFDVNATDYLLKPIAYDRFLTAINKVLTFIKLPDLKEDYIVLKENKALHKVFFDDILYLEAFGDYVKVYLQDKMIMTHSTFSNMMESLPHFFIRIHKSFCININKLSHISGNQIHLNTYKIPIGQTYKQSILNALNLDT